MEREIGIAGYPKLLEKRHENTLWTRYVTCALGIWLLAGLMTFPQPSILIGCSDALSGLALLIFGLFSMKEEKRWAPWSVCGVGIWLQIAPILLAIPTPYEYLNDTIIGVLAIALSVIIPGTPGLIESGPEVPADWSYNPSSWLQRLPVVVLGFFASLIARYLAAYHYTYINTLPDPLFGDTAAHSVSAYAAIGASLYTILTMVGCKGGSRRWHTMPWMVLLFGALVVGGGVISSLCVLFQPLTEGSWSSWGILEAVVVLLMIAFAMDEVMATLQFLIQAKKDGKSFKWTFWYGSRSVGGHIDTRSPALNAPLKSLLPAMCWGATLPVTLVLSVIVGIWLMVYRGNVHELDVANHILGAFVCLFSITAFAEVCRSVRLLNILLAIVVAVLPWYFGAANSVWTSSFVAIVLALVSIPKGSVYQRYGSLQRFIK